VPNHIISVDVPNHQQRIGGDSLMYHFCVLDDGSIYQTRDLDFPAWHAAHPEANEYYLAIHLPLGEGQDATLLQWAAVEALLAALREDYGFRRDKVRGHQEFSKTLCPGLIQARIVAYRAATDPAPIVGLTIVSVPRIAREVFAQVLRDGKSPATSVADELYTVFVSEDVDPAVGLAFFNHESSLGKAGLTKIHDLKNWGNVRSPEVAGAGEIIQIPGRGPFVRYATWQAAVRDWCKRLKGPKYAGSGLTTVEQVVPKYAPDSDSNSPARYIAEVYAFVQQWQGVKPAKTITRWRCINQKGVNVRTAPNLKGREVGVIKLNQVIEVGLVKTDGDVETIRGDNRWLWLANGSGFAWAGNFRRI
jgi:hypothetical protein